MADYSCPRLQVAVEERLYGKQLKLEEIGRCKAIRLTFNDPNTTQARNRIHSPVLFTENAGVLRGKKKAANEEVERAGGCHDR